jgi:hypothetical protein
VSVKEWTGSIPQRSAFKGRRQKPYFYDEGSLPGNAGLTIVSSNTGKTASYFYAIFSGHTGLRQPIDYRRITGDKGGIKTATGLLSIFFASKKNEQD